jgi:hypothetical protein
VLTMIARSVLVGYAPGAALFRVPAGRRDARANLGADERLFWAVLLSAVVSLSAVLALAAAHRYSFHRLLIFDALFTAAVALLARFRLRLGPAARKPGWLTLIPLALVAAGLWRFFPPSEYVIGGKDPGVYMNEGIQIAQRGSLVVRDETIAQVPAFARDLFLPSYHNATYYSLRFMGFFIKSPDEGTVVGQFPHLYPASIAIGYGIDGLTGARCAAGVWAILGVLAVYFAGARLIGWPAAAAAAALLTLNVIQVWFARYPNAEMVMQALMFAAFLANARAHVDGDPFFAPVAGAILGLLLFLRIDAVLGVAAVLVALALGFAAGQRPKWTFVAVLLVAAALNGWYLFGPMSTYVAFPVAFLLNFHWWQFVALALCGAIVAVLFLMSVRSSRVSETMIRWVPLGAAGIVLASAIYALVFRHPGGRLTAYDAYALRTYANFYVTVPALIAGLAGYALVARARFWRDPAFMVAVTGYSLFFFYKIRIVPDHFWMARRFLPVILPGTLLLVAAAAVMGARGRGWLSRGVRIPIGAVFIALLAFAYARQSKPILDHVEYAGIIPSLEHLAATIDDRDLVVVDSRDASDMHVLALPLAYIYARHVLVLASATPDKPTFAAFLNSARLRYRRVLFMGAGGTDLVSPDWSATPMEIGRIEVPEYDAPFNAYPRGVNTKKFPYGVYELGPPRPDAGLFSLDIGADDDLNVLRFFAKEITEGRTIRWTAARSFLTIDRIHQTDREIMFVMSSGGRPAAAPPADVAISAGDLLLGRVRVTGSFARYSVALPADFAAAAAARGAPVRLAIQTRTWNPSKVLGAPDDRDLGVMVDSVAVR